jgi:hypothetical protein
MKQTPFSMMAMNFRGHIVKLWARQYSGSAAEAAAKLTQEAINEGYIIRTRPVPGTALADWSVSPQSTPLWAAQAALALMINAGWRPVSDDDWCGMSALLYKSCKELSLQQLIDQLPDGLEKRIAAGWFAAAIEEDAHYRTSRKLK